MDFRLILLIQEFLTPSVLLYNISIFTFMNEIYSVLIAFT